MVKYFRLSCILSIALLLFACEEDDKFSSDSSLKLESSQDTLRFDTIFTTIASPIQKLKIYNRNDNSITISSIKLVDPESSGFRINVDGQAGSQFEDIEVLRKDSIFIFVDIKAETLNQKNANMEDAIELSWNGNTKRIRLEAHAIDVDIWDDKTIESDTHLTADKGYYIRGKVNVAEHATLSIDKGVTLYFDQKGALNINGKLVAQGTNDERITLRGHRFDLIQQDVPYDHASGQWMGVTFGANSFDNILENVTIRNSQVGIHFASSNPDRKKATLINTMVHNTSEYGIKAVNCNIDAVNCQFSNSLNQVLTLVGGKYSFLHCTIANYYRWSPRLASCVIVTDLQGQDRYPLAECNFTNSIIVGTFRDELDVLLSDPNSSALFYNCLIQSSTARDNNWFKNTIWNIDSVFLFKDLDSDRRHYYNFELIEESTAKDAANIDAAQSAPTDLRGISRFSDSKPDLGCYEWYKND